MWTYAFQTHVSNPCFSSESESCSVVSNFLRQSMEFSSPEYWSGVPFPSPGDLPNPGMEPRSPTLQADSLPAEPPGKPQEYWSGQPRPPPGELPDLGGNPGSPLQADSLPASYQGSPMVFSRANFKSVNTSLASKNTFVTQRQHLT